MKKAEFELLARLGAIDHITISKSGAGWGVWAYRDESDETTKAAWGWIKNRVDTARGEAREWASLDTAHAFITSAGYKGRVSIE